MNREEAIRFRRKIESAAELQSDEQALQSIDLFPVWKAGLSVTAGQRYQYEGVLYRVLQSHTTQADWTPDITPALFAVVSIDEWPEWIQPQGSEDAYNTGDKVSHNGSHWVSLVDSNVWVPGIYGWEEQ